MARLPASPVHTIFVRWLIAYVLLQPYTQSLAAAVSLPTWHAESDAASSSVRSTGASGACDPHGDYEQSLLCGQLMTNATSSNTTAPPHIDTPAPGTYTATHPFFVWQETNFNDSNVLGFYANWSIGASNRSKTAQPGNKIDETFLFALEHLGWTEFTCSASKEFCGCGLSPNLLAQIIEVIPNDAVRARQIYFVIRMLDWANKLVCELVNAGLTAEIRLVEKSLEFGRIFYAGRDLDAERHCKHADALEKAVIGAAIAVGVGLTVEAFGPGLLALSGAMRSRLGPLAAKLFRRGETSSVMPDLSRTNVGTLEESIALGEQGLLSSLPEWIPTTATNLRKAVFEKTYYNFIQLPITEALPQRLRPAGICGLALPEDQSFDQAAQAMLGIHSRMELIQNLLTVRMGQINTGLAPPPGHPQDVPSEMSVHLTKLFGHFIKYETIWTMLNQEHIIAKSIEGFVTDQMIETAWRSQSCYIHCTANAGKQYNAACWRSGPDMTNHPLYGWDNSKISNDAWNVDFTEVLNGSYWAWKNNRTTYLDDYRIRSENGNIDDLANTGGIRLPVCVSDYTEIQDYTEVTSGGHHKYGKSFPCTCGDSWGDDTQPFYRVDPSWYALESTGGHSHLGDYVELCRARLQEPFGGHKAQFAVNMCYVTHRAYPTNHRGLSNYHEPEGTTAGRTVCGAIVKMAYEMRLAGKKESEIDTAVCGIVANHNDGKHEKGKHEGFKRVLYEVHQKCNGR